MRSESQLKRGCDGGDDTRTAALLLLACRSRPNTPWGWCFNATSACAGDGNCGGSAFGCNTGDCSAGRVRGTKRRPQRRG
jgi:hypothetical protein